MTIGTNSEDLGLELALRHDVMNAVEARNLYQFAVRAKQRGVAPPKTSELAIFQTFLEEKIAAIVRTEPMAAMAGLFDLRCVLELLIACPKLSAAHIGLFEEHIEMIDCGLVRIGRAARDQLVARFLARDTPAEELELISATLISLIEAGQWPNWSEDFAGAVEAARLKNAS